MRRPRSFKSVLDECLDSIRQGESINDCLARYPKHAERLRPMVTLATRLPAVPRTQPRAAVQATAWDRVRQRAAEMREGKGRRGVSLGGGGWLRPVAMAAAVALAVFGGGGATVFASQSALPDSPLYRVKLFSEDARLWFVFDDNHEAEILLDQSEERMDEITAVVRNGDEIPSNVLSALENRNERAASIITDLEAKGDVDDNLVGRLHTIAVDQETALLNLWEDVSDAARDEYTRVVALAHNTRLRGATDFVALTAEDLIGGIIQMTEGEVELTSDGQWSVGGLEVQIDERTIGKRELQPGGTVSGVFARSLDGLLQALSLDSIAPPEPGFVSGAVEKVTPEGMVIAGQWIRFSPETLFKDDFSVGDPVRAELSTSDDGAIAEKVEPAPDPSGIDQVTTLTFMGTIESDVTLGSDWGVSGLSFIVPESVSIDASAGNAEQGARALVEASYENDTFTANSITILSDGSDDEAIYVVGGFGGVEDGAWIVGGLRLAPPKNVSAPEVGSVLSIDARRTGQLLRVDEWIVVGASDDENLVRWQGTVQTLDEDSWNIGIAEIGVDNSTEIAGDPSEGSLVLIFGSQDDDGMLLASYVRVLDDRRAPSTAE